MRLRGAVRASRGPSPAARHAPGGGGACRPSARLRAHLIGLQYPGGTGARTGNPGALSAQAQCAAKGGAGRGPLFSASPGWAGRWQGRGGNARMRGAQQAAWSDWT